jgi:hypothetical protein
VPRISQHGWDVVGADVLLGKGGGYGAPGAGVAGFHRALNIVERHERQRVAPAAVGYQALKSRVDASGAAVAGHTRCKVFASYSRNGLGIKNPAELTNSVASPCCSESSRCTSVTAARCLPGSTHCSGWTAVLRIGDA